MGNQIAEALQDQTGHGEPDLLSRWMAQEIAAALKQVDSARSSASRQRAVAAATELILDLWERRATWPSGWPPPGAQRRISRLTEQTKPSRAVTPHPDSSGSVWIDRSDELFRISNEELRLAYGLGLFELGVEDSRKAVDAAGPFFGYPGEEEDSDIATLRLEVAIHDDLLQSAQDAGAKTNAAIRDFAENRFAELAAERSKLVEELLSAKLRRRRRS